mmetsp:Transcript_26085/g.54640  ORF Transcript_26085/g.54640 Transcript_26085/m.54640 type:complete len:189 (-) Transcript_26085:263-829(-)
MALWYLRRTRKLVTNTNATAALTTSTRSRSRTHTANGLSSHSACASSNRSINTSSSGSRFDNTNTIVANGVECNNNKGSMSARMYGRQGHQQGRFLSGLGRRLIQHQTSNINTIASTLTSTLPSSFRSSTRSTQHHTTTLRLVDGRRSFSFYNDNNNNNNNTCCWIDLPSHWRERSLYYFKEACKFAD